MSCESMHFNWIMKFLFFVLKLRSAHLSKDNTVRAIIQGIINMYCTLLPTFQFNLSLANCVNFLKLRFQQIHVQFISPWQINCSCDF